MAKISELTELTTPSSGDFLVIVDSENNATKKIQASKVINVGHTDVISRFDYGRTNFDDIVASDFEFLELQPVTPSSTVHVQYNSGSYDLLVGGGTSSTEQTVNADFIGLRYNGSAILTSENLNIPILGSVTPTYASGEFTATFRALDIDASSGDVGAVKIRTVADEGSSTNGDRTINVTGIQINFSEKPFTASGDFTGSIKLNQTKTLTLTTPFSYRVLTDGYDGD